jgi:hypothetical protein
MAESRWMDEGALLKRTRGLLETKIGDVHHFFSRRLRSQSQLLEFNLTLKNSVERPTPVC